MQKPRPLKKPLMLIVWYRQDVRGRWQLCKYRLDFAEKLPRGSTLQLVAVFTDQMHRYSLVNTLCQAKQSTCGAVIRARSEMKDLSWHHDGEEDEMSSKELNKTNLNRVWIIGVPVVTTPNHALGLLLSV